MDSASGRSSVDDIVARLERLPTSWWQVKARIIVGVATFFDAFDALAIASILPRPASWGNCSARCCSAGLPSATAG